VSFAGGASETKQLIEESWLMEANDWNGRSHRQRCKVVASARHRIVALAEKFVQLCSSDQRRDPAETVSAELIPLCSALAYIGSQGPRVLKTRKVGLWGRPIWLFGIQSEVHRQPLGHVLILAAWNYPLLLAGVQMGQALAAGNSVGLKPALGCEAASALLVEAFYQAGVPRSVLTLMSSDTQAAQDAIDNGVDLVVLTGGTRTGRSVMNRCAEQLTPSIMELSGCDALVVGPGANLDRVAAAIAFGLSINGGATCIGPRRILVSTQLHAPLVEAIRNRFADRSEARLHPSARSAATQLIQAAMEQGAVDGVTGKRPEFSSPIATMKPTVFDRVGADWPIANSDIFAPVASIVVADSDEKIVEIVNRCEYRLAASVFGSPAWAARLATRLDVGHVSINDAIFPTADPRVPFGGCGSSGFGVTRGPEGLLAMTRPKVIARHRGSIFLHLMPRKKSDLAMLMRLLKSSHGRWWWQ